MVILCAILLHKLIDTSRYGTFDRVFLSILFLMKVGIQGSWKRQAVTSFNKWPFVQIRQNQSHHRRLKFRDRQRNQKFKTCTFADPYLCRLLESFLKFENRSNPPPACTLLLLTRLTIFYHFHLCLIKGLIIISWFQASFRRVSGVPVTWLCFMLFW